MAGSRYAYVKGFELADPLLPSTFFVIRIDGKGFHGFSKLHDFDKPNDVRALTLMNEAAKRVVGGRELNGECVVAFGESDEYRCIAPSIHSLRFALTKALSQQLRVQAHMQAARPKIQVRTRLYRIAAQRLGPDARVPTQQTRDPRRVRLHRRLHRLVAAVLPELASQPRPLARLRRTVRCRRLCRLLETDLDLT